MTDEAKRPMADGMEGWVIVPQRLSGDQLASVLSVLPSGHRYEDRADAVYAAALTAAPAYPASEAVARLVEGLSKARDFVQTWRDQVAFSPQAVRPYDDFLQSIDVALAPFLPKERS